MKYIKKPVVVEAIRWMTDNWEEVESFLRQGYCDFSIDGTNILINTLEGVMMAKPFDYIVRGIKGEYYPVMADIFEETYEKVNKIKNEGGMKDTDAVKKECRICKQEISRSDIYDERFKKYDIK
jgi:hypothetical protein